MVFRTSWWTYTAPATGTADFDATTAEGVTIKLDVFTGSVLTSLTNVGTATGTAPSVSVSVTSGVTYRVRIGTTTDVDATYSWTLDGPAPPATPSLPSSALTPWNIPSNLQTYAKKSLPHYWPQGAVSLDNGNPFVAPYDWYRREYMSPTGEGGKYAWCGGFMRDGPEPRLPRPAGTIDGLEAWRVEDAAWEITQALNAGHDGFVLNIMAYPSSGNNQVKIARSLFAGAKKVNRGFKILPSVDVTGIKQSVPIAEIAAYLHEMMSHPNVFKLGDGRPVLSAFTAEANPVSWWVSLLSALDGYGHDVAFWPMMQNVSAYRDAFASICYGMSEWGDANPLWNDPNATHATSRIGRANAVKALNGGTMKWRAPVRYEDERHLYALFDESENSTNVRFTAQIARNITGGADMIEWPTWNDFTESAHMCPSDHGGRAKLDLSSFFVIWHKTGVKPAIVRDGIFLSHRKAPWQSTPTYPQTSLMKQRPGSSAPRDTIEVYSFLTAPADITLTAGSTVYPAYTAPAGDSVRTFPLQVGTVSVEAVRSGSAIIDKPSIMPVVARSYVDDKTYYYTNTLEP